MARQKQKLTSAQKRARKKAKEERQQKYTWVFMNGKQVRLKRPETIDGLEAEEFLRNNADPIWLHQNEMREYMDQEEEQLKNIEESGLDLYINHYCGEWENEEGHFLLIEPIDEVHVHVTYMQSAEKGPLLRPWLNNMPASMMIGTCQEEIDTSLDVELSNPGDRFVLNLDISFQFDDYNTMLQSIIRYEADRHFQKYYRLFGALKPFRRKNWNGANK